MIHNLIPGIEVRIIGHKYTDKTQGMGGGSMFNMIGKVYKINKTFREAIKINGYYWDPRDLKPVKAEKQEAEMFHFDVSKLEGVE